MLLLKGKRPSVRQTIRVEKTLREEVHYYRGPSESDNQPRERIDDDGPAKITDQRDTMRSEDKSGRVVPLLRVARQG